MASPDSIRAGKAHVEIGGDTSPLEQALRSVQAKIAAWGAKIRNVGLATLGAGLAITAPLTAAAFAFAEVGDSAQKMADRTGVAVEAVQTLTYAAQQSGASAEELETGLRNMSRFLASDMTPDKLQLIESLGLSLDELQRMTPDEAFKSFAEAISKIEDPMKRTQVAMELFGRSGTRLLPMMLGGRRGIEELQDAMRPFALTAREAQEAVIFGDKFAHLKEVLLRTAAVIGSAVVPVLVDLIDMATAVLTPWIAWIRENKQLIKWIFLVGVGLMGIGSALVTVGTGVSLVAMVVGALATVFGALATVVGFLMTPLGLLVLAIGASVLSTLIGLVAGVAGAIAVLYMFGWRLEHVRKLFKDVMATIQWMIPGVSDLGATFAAVKDAIAIGDWGAAFEVGLLGMELAFERFKNWLLDIWSSLTFEMLTAWDSLVAQFGPTLQPAIRGIFDLFHAMLSQIENAVNTMLGALPKAMRQRLGLNQVDLTSGLTEFEAVLEPGAGPRVAQQTDRSREMALEQAFNAESMRLADERANMEYWETWEVGGAPSPGAAGMAMVQQAEVGSTMASFSAAALSQMGATSTMDRVAEFTERTARATEEIARREDEEGVEVS